MGVEILPLVLPIIAVLIKFFVDWLARRSAAKVDPVEQNKKRYEQIDKDIVGKNDKAASANGVNDLDDLDRLQNRSGDRVK